MSLLSSTFGAIVRTRNRLYDSGRLPNKKLQGPVVSIGNLSVGGAGKTPFVIALGELLKARGIKFDVLSRGYGRKSRGVALVNPAGLASDFGDEPILIARKLGVSVVVGEDRYQAGQFAEAKFGPQMHLLDDGFQHRRLARDFDIVLITPEDAQDQLLPAGGLREPLSSLSRADAVVLTTGANEADFPIKEKLIWRAKRGIVSGNLPSSPVAFCGIARPKPFLLQLRLFGIHPVAEAIFRDHHSYTESDVRDLLKAKAESGADGFVTTEKDEINLGPLRERLQPLGVAPLKMQIVDGPRVVDAILTALEAKRHSRTAQPVL